MLKSNYVGIFENFSTSEEYRARRDDPSVKAEYERNLNIKDIFLVHTTNPLEVWFDLHLYSSILYLPDELYGQNNPLFLHLPSIAVAITNTHRYQDFVLTVPIAHLSDNPDILDSPTSNFLSFFHFVWETARLYGPRPKTLSYVSRWKFLFDRVLGQLDLASLAKLANFLDFFFFHFSNAEDYVEGLPANQVDLIPTQVSLLINELAVSFFCSAGSLDLGLHEGLFLHSDGLITPFRDLILSLQLPRLTFRHYLSSNHWDEPSGNGEVPIASFVFSVELVSLGRSRNLAAIRQAQQNYLRAQDSETRRCTLLYEVTGTNGSQDVWDYFPLQMAHGYRIQGLGLPHRIGNEGLSRFTTHIVFRDNLFRFYNSGLDSTWFLEQTVADLSNYRPQHAGLHGFQQKTSFSKFPNTPSPHLPRDGRTFNVVLTRVLRYLHDRRDGNQKFLLPTLGRSESEHALKNIRNELEDVSLITLNFLEHEPLIIRTPFWANFPMQINAYQESKSSVNFLFDSWYVNYIQHLVSLYRTTMEELNLSVFVKSMNIILEPPSSVSRLFSSKKIPESLVFTAQQLLLRYRKSAQIPDAFKPAESPRYGRTNSERPESFSSFGSGPPPERLDAHSQLRSSGIYASFSLEMERLLCLNPPTSLVKEEPQKMLFLLKEWSCCNSKHDFQNSSLLSGCLESVNLSIQTVSGSANRSVGPISFIDCRVSNLVFDINIDLLPPDMIKAAIDCYEDSIGLVSFTLERSRLIHQWLLQGIILEVAKASSVEDVSLDPVFLTRPSTIWRLGTRPFQDETGWRLIHHLRSHFAHLMRSKKGEESKSIFNLSMMTMILESIDMDHYRKFVNDAFATVVKTLSNWRYWEMGDVYRCDLVLHLFRGASMDQSLEYSTQNLEPTDVLLPRESTFTRWTSLVENTTISAWSSQSLSRMVLKVQSLVLLQSTCISFGVDYVSYQNPITNAPQFRPASSIQGITCPEVLHPQSGPNAMLLTRVGSLSAEFEAGFPHTFVGQIIGILGSLILHDSHLKDGSGEMESTSPHQSHFMRQFHEHSMIESNYGVTDSPIIKNYMLIIGSCLFDIRVAELLASFTLENLLAMKTFAVEQSNEIEIAVSDSPEDSRPIYATNIQDSSSPFSTVAFSIERTSCQLSLRPPSPSQDSPKEGILITPAIDLSIGTLIFSIWHNDSAAIASQLLKTSLRINSIEVMKFLACSRQLLRNLREVWRMHLSVNKDGNLEPFSLSDADRRMTIKFPYTLRSRLIHLSDFELSLTGSYSNITSTYTCASAYLRHWMDTLPNGSSRTNGIALDVYRHQFALGESSSHDLPMAVAHIKVNISSLSGGTQDSITSPEFPGPSPLFGRRPTAASSTTARAMLPTNAGESSFLSSENQAHFMISSFRFILDDNQILRALLVFADFQYLLEGITRLLHEGKNCEEESTVIPKKTSSWCFRVSFQGFHVLISLQNTFLVMDMSPSLYYFVTNFPGEPQGPKLPLLIISSTVTFQLAIWRQTAVAENAYKLRKLLMTSVRLCFNDFEKIVKDRFPLHITTFLIMLYPSLAVSYDDIVEDLKRLLQSDTRLSQHPFMIFNKKPETQTSIFPRIYRGLKTFQADVTLNEFYLAFLFQDEVYDRFGEDTFNFYTDMFRGTPSLQRHAPALVGAVEQAKISTHDDKVDLYHMRYHYVSLGLIENFDSKLHLRSCLKTANDFSSATSSLPRNFMSMSSAEMTMALMSQDRWITFNGVLQRYDVVLDSRIAGHLRRFLMSWMAVDKRPPEPTPETTEGNNAPKELPIMPSWSVLFSFECLPGTLKLFLGDQHLSPSSGLRHPDVIGHEWLLPYVRLSIVYQYTTSSGSPPIGSIDLSIVPQKNVTDPSLALFLNECLRNYERAIVPGSASVSATTFSSSRLASISKENWYLPFRRGSWYLVLHLQEQNIELNCGHFGRVSCILQITPCKLLASLIPDEISGQLHVVGSYVLPELNIRLGHSFASDGCFKAQIRQLSMYFDHPIESWGKGSVPTRIFLAMESFQVAINARYLHDIHIFRRVWFRKRPREASVIGETSHLSRPPFSSSSSKPPPSTSRFSPSSSRLRIKSYYIPPNYDSSTSGTFSIAPIGHLSPLPPTSADLDKSSTLEQEVFTHPSTSKLVSRKLVMPESGSDTNLTNLPPLPPLSPGPRSRSAHLSEEYRELPRLQDPTSSSKEMYCINFVCSQAMGDLDLSQILGKMQFSIHQGFGRCHAPLHSGHSQFILCADRVVAESKGRIGFAATSVYPLISGKLSKGQIRFSLNAYHRLCDLFCQMMHFSFQVEYPIEKVFLLDMEQSQCSIHDQWRRDALMDISAINIDVSLEARSIRVLVAKDTAPALSYIRKCLQRLFQHRTPSSSQTNPKGPSSSSLDHGKESESPLKQSTQTTMIEQSRDTPFRPHIIEDLMIYTLLVCRDHALLPISHLRINLHKFSCALYSTFADSDWARLAIDEFFLRLNEASHPLSSNTTFSSHKDVLLHMKGMEIAKCSNDHPSAKSKRHFSEDQWMDYAFAMSSASASSAVSGLTTTAVAVIAKLPPTIVTMETDHVFTQCEINYHFAADFNDAIYVNLNIGMYQFFQDLAATYLKSYRREFFEDYPHRHGETTESAMPSPSNEPSRVTADLEFHAIGPIQFNPKLLALGEATPRIEKIFEWLGIDRETLPKCLHRGVAIPLVHGLWRINRHMIHRIVSKDRSSLDPTPIIDRHSHRFVHPSTTSSPMLYATSMYCFLGSDSQSSSHDA